CSLVSSLLLSGATMSQQSSLTQSAHSVRPVLTAYTPCRGLRLPRLKKYHASPSVSEPVHIKAGPIGCRDPLKSGDDVGITSLGFSAPGRRVQQSAIRPI